MGQQRLAALLSDGLPDAPLPRHNCSFVSAGLTPFGSWSGSFCHSEEDLRRRRAKIRPNPTPSPEQLVSAVARLAGWLESSWPPLAKPYAPGFTEMVCFFPSLLSSVPATPPRFNNLYSWPVSRSGYAAPPSTPLVCWAPKSRSEEVAERGKKLERRMIAIPTSTCQCRAVSPPQAATDEMKKKRDRDSKCINSWKEKEKKICV